MDLSSACLLSQAMLKSMIMSAVLLTFSTSDTDPCYHTGRYQLEAECCSRITCRKVSCCFELAGVSAVTTYHIKFQAWCGRHMLNPTVLLCHPGFACNAIQAGQQRSCQQNVCSTSIHVVLPGQLFTTQLCESRRCSRTWDRA